MAAHCRLTLGRLLSFGETSCLLKFTPCIRNNRVNQHGVCRFCSSSESRPWQLMSGVCVERYPVISQALNTVEKEFKELCDQEEFEASVLSNHEIQVRKDRDRMKKRQEGEIEEDDAGDDREVMTALDKEDLATEKLKQFQPSPRETKADQESDLKSINRKLDDKLVLLVKEKIGDRALWVLPQGYRERGESMREAAERVLNSCSEENTMKVKFWGNAPVGVYKYKYPKDVQDKLGAQGAKVFFFKATLMKGDFKHRPNGAISDYKWLTREELDSHLMTGYSDALKRFILPVSW